MPRPNLRPNLRPTHARPFPPVPPAQNLGKEPEALKWYAQAELQNGRWAMLGVAGILVPELLGSATPATTNYNWVRGAGGGRGQALC